MKKITDMTIGQICEEIAEIDGRTEELAEQSRAEEITEEEVSRLADLNAAYAVFESKHSREDIIMASLSLDGLDELEEQDKLAERPAAE